jgi:glycosyltransferase involved in cell wall biosynthesis
MKIAVVIPTYNHAKYLVQALQSVLNQSLAPTEIIVVDDGSTDNTHELVGAFNEVAYLKQENKGLSAARNAGWRHTKSPYVVFLDADDLLLPDALRINADCIEKNPMAAFVSGCHNLINEFGYTTEDAVSRVEQPGYESMLKRNYIGMNGTVMYKRETLEKFPFDEELKACEDYDQYLRIMYTLPTIHHTNKIAAYRKHGANMSSNAVIMFTEVLKVLDRQKQKVRTAAEIEALREGRKYWKEKYLPSSLQDILKNTESTILRSRKWQLVRRFWYPMLKLYVGNFFRRL